MLSGLFIRALKDDKKKKTAKNFLGVDNPKNVDVFGYQFAIKTTVS